MRQLRRPFTLAFSVLWGTLLVGTLAGTGCDAPHNNPFDPRSPGYQPPPPPSRDRIGQITARAWSLYQVTWVPPDIVELRSTAAIADSDIVDSVWATSDLGDLGQLLLILDGVTWSTQLAEHQLPTLKLERLVGHPIWIHYRDRAGFVSRSEPVRLVRIIYTPPQTESPSNTTVSAHPRLTWLLYDADFDFTYTVEIVHVSNDYTLTPIYRREGISSDSTGHTVAPDSLRAIPRFYIWTVSVEDEFGDRAISLETTFTVDGGE